MKILAFIFEIIVSPFTALFRANAKPSPNKQVHPILVFIIAAIAVALLVLLIYNEVIFKWYSWMVAF